MLKKKKKKSIPLIPRITDTIHNEEKWLMAAGRPNLRNQLHDSGLHLERVAKLELTNDNDNDQREQQGWPFTCDNNRKLV